MTTELNKNGRDVLALLYDHTNERPSSAMKELLAALDSAGLADHPAVAGLCERIHDRITPIRVTTAPADDGKPKGGRFAQLAPATSAVIQALE